MPPAPNAEQLNELLKLDDDALVTAAEAALVCRLSYHTLNWYRNHTKNGVRYGPKFIQLAPQAIRYRMGDLRAFIVARREG